MEPESRTAGTIRSAVLVQPEKIELQEFPFPQLENGALLLKVEMCGICGTDKHTWRGETKQYPATEAESGAPFPIIPGHEVIFHRLHPHHEGDAKVCASFPI